MKNIKYFLRGYFYAAKLTNGYDSNLNECYIHTKNGGKLIFAINRGISHIIGNMRFAFNEPENSLFDIHKSWVSKETWDFIGNNDNEIRIDFDLLCQLIKELGGIDFKKM